MRHRQLWTAALSAALAGVMAASAFAQAGPGGPGGPGGAGQPGQRAQMRGMMDSSFLVIRMSTVQRHLELSAAQIEQINALPRMGGGRMQPGEAGAGPGQRRQGQAGAGAGAAGGQAGQRRQGGQAGQAQPGAPRPDPLAEILNARQMARFRQLVAQFESPMSMLRPEHAQRLQLTQEQRTQVMEIARGLMPAGGRAQGQAQPDPARWRQDWEARMQAREEAAAKAVALLTAPQRRTWQSIVGPAFTQWELPRGQGGAAR